MIKNVSRCITRKYKRCWPERGQLRTNPGWGANSRAGAGSWLLGFALAGVGVGLGGCGGHGVDADVYQGVVEHDERLVAFELGGRVRSVSVKRGQLVEQGAVLAELDDSLQRPLRAARAAEVEALEAQLDLLRAGSRYEEIRAIQAKLGAAKTAEGLAQKSLDRQRRLVQDGAAGAATLDVLEGQLSRARGERQALEQQLRALRSGARPQQLRAAEAKLEAAKASLRALDEQLARHVLTAPASGEVVDVHVDPGEVTGPGTPVVSLADTQRPYVDAFVPQGGLAGIKVGCRAIIRVDSYDEPFAGAVDGLGSRTEFTPRFLFSERERPNLVVRVRVRASDPEARLHAGVPALVTIDTSSCTPPPDGTAAPRPPGPTPISSSTADPAESIARTKPLGPTAGSPR